MYEIAEPTPNTSLAAVEPTASFPKVRDRAKLAVDRPRSIPSTIERVAGLLRRVFVLEPRVHIPNQMVIVIVAHYDLLHFAVLAHLAPQVLVEGVEMVLELGGIHARFVVVGRILVEIWHEDCLGIGGLDMFA